MKYMEPFNRNVDVFSEYKLYYNDGEEMYSDRLTVLLRYIKLYHINKYIIYGITRSGIEKILLDIKKPTL